LIGIIFGKEEEDRKRN